MGGTPPLGYAPDGRSLSIVDEHASIIRRIYTRYLALGSVRLLAEELERQGIGAPARMTLGGKAFGGVTFSRGQLYTILCCPTYVGEIHHQGRIHTALHAPIVERSIWDAVQAMLAQHRQGERRRGGRATASLLAGKVVDAEGVPLVATHASKGAARYRYYVSRDLQTGTSSTGLRIPATELEAVVTQRIASAFADPLALAAAAQLTIAPGDVARLCSAAEAIAGSTGAALRATAGKLFTAVRVHDGRIDIDCAGAAIATVLGAAADPDTADTVTLPAHVRLTRSGRVMRLVQASGAGVTATANGSVIRLILQARRWWAILKEGELDISMLAAQETVQPAYVTRVLRLAFLSPAVVEAILAGGARAGVDGAMLTSTGAISSVWACQAETCLPHPHS